MGVRLCRDDNDGVQVAKRQEWLYCVFRTTCFTLKTNFMKATKTFNPTAAQIDAANNLAMAMAFHKTVKETFLEFTKVLLASGRFHYADEYRENGKKYSRMLDEGGMPENGVISNPDHVGMMAGLSDLGKPEYESSDSALYYYMLGQMATAAGFKNAENSECIAANEEIAAKTAFLIACEPITGMTDEQLARHWPIREKVLDMTFSLFGPYLKGPKDGNLKEYYDARMTR